MPIFRLSWVSTNDLLVLVVYTFIYWNLSSLMNNSFQNISSSCVSMNYVFFNLSVMTEEGSINVLIYINTNVSKKRSNGLFRSTLTLSLLLSKHIKTSHCQFTCKIGKIKFVCLKCLKNRYFVTTIKWRKIHWYLKYLRNVVNDSLMTHEKIINKILCIHFFIYELLNYIKKKTKV